MCDCVLWTADIGADYGDVRPLDEARIQTLIDNRTQLLERIDSNRAFVTEIAAADCITWLQREYIVDTPQRCVRNDKILDLLSRRSVADFHKFTRVLAKEQDFLVPLFVTNGGEILNVWWMSFSAILGGLSCTPTVTTIHSLFDHATDDRHMNDGGV